MHLPNDVTLITSKCRGVDSCIAAECLIDSKWRPHAENDFLILTGIEFHTHSVYMWRNTGRFRSAIQGA